MEGRQLDDLNSAAGEEGIGADKKGVRPLLASNDANAALISRLVLTRTTWICSALARAAASACLR